MGKRKNGNGPILAFLWSARRMFLEREGALRSEKPAGNKENTAGKATATPAATQETDILVLFCL